MQELILLDMIRYFGHDTRRVNHALKVYAFAQAISGLEMQHETDRLVTNLAALLHDIGIHEAERKYGSTAGKYQELEGPPIAGSILEARHMDKDIIERVCHLVGHHHSYHLIDGLDFQILIEADFLVNIHEDEMGSEQIISIRHKYFKTGTGLKLLSDLYGASS